MMLRHKMAFETGALIVSLLLISAASLWGINGLHQDFGSALRGNAQLRRVFEIGFHIAAARRGLSQPSPNPSLAQAEISAALSATQSGAPTASSGARSTMDTKIDAHLLQPLREIRLALRAPDADWPELAGRLDLMQRHIADLASEIRTQIQQSQDDASRKRHATFVVISALSAGVVVAAIAIGIYQYRGVIKPLQRLGHGVRKIATGSFGERITPQGDGEFLALAQDFNRMASELDNLYRELEQKVAVKRRELVRSERLASVGFLAAGVAHEINNPLGIIAGYAELSLKELEAQGCAESEPANALRIICDEAFRCKDITQKLLSLARPGNDARERISLARVVRDIVSLLSGLKDFRDRRLTADTQEDCEIVANESEIKQVLLNLALNALEATTPNTGEVKIAVCQAGGDCILSIEDNGRGISAESLERIFEPFFTDKRGAGKPGTGLGLSITHAIIQSHHGTLSAQSAGVGHGSTFTITLPRSDHTEQSIQ